MKETKLWDHIRDHLKPQMKIHKTNDRFTLGLPDLMGSWRGRAAALELKRLEGVRVIRTKFRPRQLDFLMDWEVAGGCSLIVSSWNNIVTAHEWQYGESLEAGVSPQELQENALLWFPKVRGNSWVELIDHLDFLIK